MDIGYTTIKLGYAELKGILSSIDGFYRRFIEGDRYVRELHRIIQLNSPIENLLYEKAEEGFSGNSITGYHKQVLEEFWEKMIKTSYIPEPLDIYPSFTTKQSDEEISILWVIRGKDVDSVPSLNHSDAKAFLLTLLMLSNVSVERLIDFSLFMNFAYFGDKEVIIQVPDILQIEKTVKFLTPVGARKIFEAIVEDRCRNYFYRVYYDITRLDIVKALSTKLTFKDIERLFKREIYRKNSFGGMVLSYSAFLIQDVPESLQAKCYETLLRVRKEKGIKGTEFLPKLPFLPNYVAFDRAGDLVDRLCDRTLKFFADIPSKKTLKNKMVV